MNTRITPEENSSSGDSREQKDEAPNHVVRDSTGSGLGLIGVLKAWKLEMIFYVLAIIALMAIVATLLPFQGRPLPKWPYHLSINALLSIYIVVFKASILLVLTQGE
jgi:Protein of unknown function (DUF3176)